MNTFFGEHNAHLTACRDSLIKSIGNSFAESSSPSVFRLKLSKSICRAFTCPAQARLEKWRRRQILVVFSLKIGKTPWRKSSSAKSSPSSRCSATVGFSLSRLVAFLGARCLVSPPRTDCQTLASRCVILDAQRIHRNVKILALLNPAADSANKREHFLNRCCLIRRVGRLRSRTA